MEVRHAWIVPILLLSITVVRYDAAGYNELGYTRTGPLQPLLYPESVSVSYVSGAGHASQLSHKLAGFSCCTLL